MRGAARGGAREPPSRGAKRKLPAEPAPRSSGVIDMLTSVGWSRAMLCGNGSACMLMAVGMQSGHVVLWLWRSALGSLSHEDAKRFSAHRDGVADVAWARLHSRACIR